MRSASWLLNVLAVGVRLCCVMGRDAWLLVLSVIIFVIVMIAL